MCVVGAGYAGLSAARHAARAGRDVCVLEARDRVGGRIWSVERAGHRIDIGGAWLGPQQDAVHALVREFGIATHPTFDTGDIVLTIGDDVRRFHGQLPRVSPIAIGALALGMARIDMMAKKVPLDAPWNARRAGQWDARSAGDWVHRNLPRGAGRDLLDAAVRGLMTCDPSEVSLLHFLYLVRSAGSLNALLAVEGGYQQDLVVGGATLMAEGLADELGDRVLVEQPVRAITQSDREVEITTDSLTVHAERVVVAVPPALILRIQFTPALPADRAQLNASLLSGSVIKFVVQYPDAFWRADGLSGQTIGMGSPIEMTLDAGEPGGSPGVMTAFAFGPPGRELGALAPDVRKKIVLDALVVRFGARAAEPIDFAERDWAAEEWSRGCYMAHMPPGVMTQYGRLLRQPCGRIHWAGTETATKSHGAIDGAIRSGIRAADEVLGLLP
jgi:monoamine oxidase